MFQLPVIFMLNIVTSLMWWTFMYDTQPITMNNIQNILSCLVSQCPTGCCIQIAHLYYHGANLCKTMFPRI